jgi:hypothetical protein
MFLWSHYSIGYFHFALIFHYGHTYQRRNNCRWSDEFLQVQLSVNSNLICNEISATSEQMRQTNSDQLLPPLETSEYLPFCCNTFRVVLAYSIVELQNNTKENSTCVDAKLCYLVLIFYITNISPQCYFPSLWTPSNTFRK